MTAAPSSQPPPSRGGGVEEPPPLEGGGWRRGHGRFSLASQGCQEISYAVIVYSLDHALAAAAAAESACVPLTICGMPGAGENFGAGWFVALRDIVLEKHPALGLTILMDCAEEAGTALGALRRGLDVVFTGPETAFGKIAEIAAPLGRMVLRRQPPALDLLGCRDPAAACREWFAPGGGKVPREVASPTALR